MGAVEAALKATAALLLLPPDTTSAQMVKLADELSRAIIDSHGGGAVQPVPVCLIFLGENTGVPRDMSAAAARALRSHLTLVASAIECRTLGED